MIDLSIVIITWNKADVLKACLESIFAQQTRFTFEVVLVVNASTDHTLEVLKSFDRVKTILNPENRGVAPARNQGIAQAKGRILMMLDDDTTMHAGCIEHVVDGMDHHPDAWGAGTKTLNPVGELELNARTFYTLPSAIVRALLPSKSSLKIPFIRKHFLLDWNHAGDRVVDWVAGASFIMTREAIEQIGAFDERFFFGCEDVEWCYRVHRSGKEIYYLAKASIMHYVQGSSRKYFSKKFWMHRLNFLYLYWKCRGFRRVQK